MCRCSGRGGWNEERHSNLIVQNYIVSVSLKFHLTLPKQWRGNKPQPTFIFKNYSFDLAIWSIANVDCIFLWTILFLKVIYRMGFFSKLAKIWLANLFDDVVLQVTQNNLAQSKFLNWKQKQFSKTATNQYYSMNRKIFPMF